MENIKLPFYAKISLMSIGMLALCTMLYLSRSILIPLIYATILAILLSPVVDLLVRKKMNRTFAISITVVLFISLTIALLFFLSSQIVQFSDSFPKLIHNLQTLLNETVLWISDQFNIRRSKINLWITEKNTEIQKTKYKRLN